MMLNNYNTIDTFIELIPDIAFFKDVEGRYLHCNQALLNFMNLSRDEIINKTDFDIFPNETAEHILEADRRILSTNQDESLEEIVKKKNTDDTYFHSFKQVIYDDAGKQLGLFCIAQNITLQKQYELIYEDSQKILESIAIHNDFRTVLDEIVDLAEQRKRTIKCSVLLLDQSKKHLFKGSAPSLPDFYNDAINGVEIGEKVGSCGSAAFTKKRVIVENIDQHENWQPYLELTRKANLHSCWSEPIFSSNDEILGTFAIYNDKPTYPTEFELKLISLYAHLASLAIEKSYNETLIKEKETQILEQTRISNIKLKQSQDELSLLFNNALDGLMYITGERILIKGNQRLADILGYENPQEMVGFSMREIHLSEERFIEFGKKNFYTLADGVNFNIEYQLKKKNGSSIWCELSGKALDDTIPADLSKGVLWTVIDISKRKVLEEEIQQRTEEVEYKNKQLRELASKDHLTGLYNRSKLDETLEYQLKHSKRSNTPFGLILIDIDFFKSVNDEHGHQAGDTILCEFSSLLTRYSRECDVVGRWGGEEFLIIVEDTDEKSIVVFAEKLRKTIELYQFSIVKHKTASFGATIYHPEDKPNSIVSRVDAALYEAKKSGRNKVYFL